MHRTQYFLSYAVQTRRYLPLGDPNDGNANLIQCEIRCLKFCVSKTEICVGYKVVEMKTEHW